MARGDGDHDYIGYDHENSLVGNNKVVYNVETSGDRWFRTGYNQHVNNTTHADAVNEYGVESVVSVANACPGSPGC
tara:strand:- start:131 stop:358 length:228 start_codon:yes stop_codon:yes gene_type:complete